MCRCHSSSPVRFLWCARGGPELFACRTHSERPFKGRRKQKVLLRFSASRTLTKAFKAFYFLMWTRLVFCPLPGSTTAAGGRKHSAETGRENLQSDGQEPRRQAHPGGVPRGQQSRPAHSAGAFARRRQLIDAHAQGKIHWNFFTNFLFGLLGILVLFSLHLFFAPIIGNEDNWLWSSWISIKSLT